METKELSSFIPDQGDWRSWLGGRRPKYTCIGISFSSKDLYIWCCQLVLYQIW